MIYIFNRVIIALNPTYTKIWKTKQIEKFHRQFYHKSSILSLIKKYCFHSILPQKFVYFFLRQNLNQDRLTSPIFDGCEMGYKQQMSKSYITRVFKGTINQQNQTNTLQQLRKKSLIPQCPTHKIDSKVLESSSLKSLPSSSDRLLVKLNGDNYYYGLIKGGQASDQNCIFIFHDGTYYQGQIKDGNFEGRGKLTQASVDLKEVIFEYDGEWKRGKPEGQGREDIMNSITYEGGFKNGKKNGFGKMTYRDGTVYEGEFKDNAIEGKGKYTTKAHEWQGAWRQGYLEGEGRQTSFGQEEEGEGEEEEEAIATQSVYRGGFKRGQKDGVGTYTWGNDFSEYTGHFSNGQLDGEGRIKIGQTEYIGEWKKGVQLRLNAATASKIQFKKVQKRPNEQPI